MPKGKKCSQLNCKGRMRRCYTRSYWDGIKYDLEDIMKEIPIKKGKYNPQGWLCDECGIFIPDEKNYWMNKGCDKRKNKQKRIKSELRYKLKRIRWNFMDYMQDHTQRDSYIDGMNKMYRFRFINITSEMKTYSWLKGYRKGNKESREYYMNQQKELIEREYNDDAILKKAKMIESGRRYRGET